MAADVRYCVRCVIPDSKPMLSFDERGVCAACQAHELKHEHLQGIDWNQRKAELDRLVEWGRDRNAPLYDVLVMVGR